LFQNKNLYSFFAGKVDFGVINKHNLLNFLLPADVAAHDGSKAPVGVVGVADGKQGTNGGRDQTTNPGETPPVLANGCMEEQPTNSDSMPPVLVNGQESDCPVGVVLTCGLQAHHDDDKTLAFSSGLTSPG
jgi:hypothetical protein